MKNISLCHLDKNDLKSLSNINVKELARSFEDLDDRDIYYRFRYEVLGEETKYNTLTLSNSGRFAAISIYFESVQRVPDIIEHLENKYPLDFSYYSEIIKKANAIYERNSFFSTSFEPQYTINSWNQFLPSKRKRKVSQYFLKKQKIIHTSMKKKDSEMVLTHKLGLAKIQLIDGQYLWVPVVKFSLPMSRNTNKSLLASASAEYPFLFSFTDDCFIHDEIDTFMNKLNTSVMTHVYNNLVKTIDMDNVKLKDFKQIDESDRERFITIAKMLKV